MDVKLCSALKELAALDEGWLAKYLTDPEKDMELKRGTADMLAEAGLRGRTALDIGCGIPYLLHCLKERGVVCTGTGMDMQESAARAGELLGVRVERMEITPAIQFPGVFDVVLCFRCNLDRVGSPGLLKRFISSKVAPGGFLVMSPNRLEDPSWSCPDAWSAYMPVYSSTEGRSEGGRWVMMRRSFNGEDNG